MEFFTFSLLPSTKLPHRFECVGDLKIEHDMKQT